MEHYGSITTPVSVPRLIVGAMLAAGVAVLIMAFTKYGLLAGLAVSVIPAALSRCATPPYRCSGCSWSTISS